MFKNTKRTALPSPLARSMIATWVSSCHALSNTSAATILLCVIQAFLCEVGIDAPIEKVVAACSGKDAFQSTFHDEAVDILSLMRRRMTDTPLFFSCDGANKSAHHAIKMFSFW